LRLVASDISGLKGLPSVRLRTALLFSFFRNGKSWDDALRVSVSGGFLDLRRGGLGPRFRPSDGITCFLQVEGIVGAFKELLRGGTPEGAFQLSWLYFLSCPVSLVRVCARGLQWLASKLHRFERASTFLAVCWR
jgi:hypothetical protein